MLGFSHNGVHSSTYSGIYMKSKSRPILPQKRVSEETVTNRHGSYKFEDGYNDRIIEIECSFLTTNIKLRRQILREIGAWLSQKGQLIFDDEPDKYYIAQLYAEIDLDIGVAVDTFTLSFVCEPFAYTILVNEDITLDSDIVLYSNIELDGAVNTFSITGNTTIQVNNFGTFEALPVIEITGTADSITIEDFTINNVTEKVYVDCKNMLCYTVDANGNKVNKLKDFSGSFIKLNTRTNSIDISGTSMSNVSVFFNFKNTWL